MSISSSSPYLSKPTSTNAQTEKNVINYLWFLSLECTIGPLFRYFICVLNQKAFKGKCNRKKKRTNYNMFRRFLSNPYSSYQSLGIYLSCPPDIFHSRPDEWMVRWMNGRYTYIPLERCSSLDVSKKEHRLGQDGRKKERLKVLLECF